jgi:hypothetical protein
LAKPNFEFQKRQKELEKKRKKEEKKQKKLDRAAAEAQPAEPGARRPTTTVSHAAGRYQAPRSIRLAPDRRVPRLLRARTTGRPKYSSSNSKPAPPT